jgi:hypothetical protein
MQSARCCIVILLRHGLAAGEPIVITYPASPA